RADVHHRSHRGDVVRLGQRIQRRNGGLVDGVAVAAARDRPEVEDTPQYSTASQRMMHPQRADASPGPAGRMNAEELLQEPDSAGKRGAHLLFPGTREPVRGLLPDQSDQVAVAAM